PPPLIKTGETISLKFFDPEIYFIMSMVREMDGAHLYKKAVDEATRAISLADTPKLKAHLLAMRGGVYADWGKYDEAFEDLYQAIVSDPNNATIYCDVGYTHIRAGDYTNAIKVLSDAIMLDPKLGVAYLNRGAALRGLGRHTEARSDLDVAVELATMPFQKA